MSDLIDRISAFLNDSFGATLPSIRPTDVIEILIIAFFIYRLLTWIKSTRAWNLMKGLLFIVLFFALAAVFQMSTILWLGSRLFSAGIMAVVVVFQPELRRALDRLGRQDFARFFMNIGLGKGTVKRFEEKTLQDLVKGSYEMGAVKTGALIVIEQNVQLEEYVRTGIMVDAVLTRQLLLNIFEKNTPLHDGAIIVRGDRVVAATCYLPLSDNSNLSKDLGTRHRAAVGISEVSDALTIVVSEETGKVSITYDGAIKEGLNPDELEEELKKIQYQNLKAEEENPEEGGEQL